MGDDDQADVRLGVDVCVVCHGSLHSARSSFVDVVSAADAAQNGDSVAASSSSATVVAPGSWWPTLRSPR